MNKPTLDKVRNYFYGRCNDGEEVRIQQWFADNGNSSEADRLLGALLDEVRSRFDYCLIDSGAGLGDAFRLATCAADRAVVVATTDPTSLRDAQRTVMELHDYPNGRLHLVVNRVRRKLLKALSSNIDDAIDAAGLPLLGVIPEDEGIPIALGRSALTVFSRESSAEIACRNIARRLTGERVPLMKLPRR